MWFHVFLFASGQRWRQPLYHCVYDAYTLHPVTLFLDIVIVGLQNVLEENKIHKIFGMEWFNYVTYLVVKGCNKL